MQRQTFPIKQFAIARTSTHTLTQWKNLLKQDRVGVFMKVFQYFLTRKGICGGFNTATAPRLIRALGKTAANPASTTTTTATRESVSVRPPNRPPLPRHPSFARFPGPVANLLNFPLRVHSDISINILLGRFRMLN